MSQIRYILDSGPANMEIKHSSDVNLYSLDATRQIVDHTNVYKAVLLVEQAKINRLHIDTIHQYVVHTKNVHETTMKTVEIHVRMRSGKRC